MKIIELKNILDDYLSDPNNNGNEEVIFLLRGEHLMGDFPINDYGIGNDHIQLQYIHSTN